MADDQLAGHQAGQLPGSDAGHRLVEGEREARMATRAGGLAHASGERAVAVAQAHPIDVRAVAVQRRVAHEHPVALQSLARPHGHGVARGVGGEHVERLASAEPEPAPLTDRVVVVSAVLAEPLAVLAEDRARALPESAVARQERAATDAGQEAQVLRVGLAGHRQPVGRGELADLRLRQLPEREAQPRERRRRQAGEHVALVLGRVGGDAQERLAGPRPERGSLTRA